MWFEVDIIDVFKNIRRGEKESLLFNKRGIISYRYENKNIFI